MVQSTSLIIKLNMFGVDFCKNEEYSMDLDNKGDMGQTDISFNGCTDSMGQTEISFSGCTDSVVARVRLSFDMQVLIWSFIYLYI